jgi:AraC-like DNA-binding protein
MFERLDSRFDVLTQVLEAVRLGSPLSARIELSAPWALHFGPETGQRSGFHAVVAGHCWVKLDDVADTIALNPGDVVVIPHGTGHVVADHPDTVPLELGAYVSALPPGGRLALPFNGDGEATVVLCGSYSFGSDGAHPLLQGLPPLLHIRAERSGPTPLAAVIDLLEGESSAKAGSAVIVSRLVELLFVYALRAWLDQLIGPARSGWLSALQDPVVGPAVQAIHEDPAHPWTVQILARRTGRSRAALARRFSETLGEPPLAYVTRWRMTIAAELLEQGERIATVAHRVGYRNEFAFAKAFKRVRGIAPGRSRHRRRL